MATKEKGDFKITPVDETKEKEGVWADYFGVELLIGRANTEAFRKLFSGLCRPFLAQPGIDTYEQIPEQDQQRIMVEVISKTLLFNWKPNSRFKHEYSQEMAVLMLEADLDCRKFISEFANNLSNFYTDELEAMSAKQ